ncbi:type II toxin-antitoxin system HigB family toxin [Dolichospermum sp. FACHB-1091]|nr:type II toxin-antitoxin system HigB family toxin [Dolichospermum sp. FACHB-1091]
MRYRFWWWFDSFCGNKYRLITSIHFNRQKVYICYILTHSEYDKNIWKN